MKILLLGDIVGEAAKELLCKHLWNWRRELGVSLVIANGENVCMGKGNGLDRTSAQELLQCGVDVLTGGNHTFRKSSLYPLLEEENGVLRPANYPDSAPGRGDFIADADGYRVLVLNVMGQVYLEPMRDPFDTVEAILRRREGEYDLAILDVHAEATSEKAAIAYAFDGRLTAVVGTHTHVATADAQILPRGTAFQSDLGMCGPIHSILGVKTENILFKFRQKLPTAFEVGDGEIQCNGAILEVDPSSGKVLSFERFAR